jgi:hypothetical protein
MKLKNSFIILLFLLGIQSCKNDIEINAPWKETAIVNGFLDIGTAQQYIRITKTFQNASNLTPQQAAQISDSVYFDTLIVNVIDLTSGVDTFSFIKTTSIPKDTGYFASDKNILYYCNNMLPKLGHVYQLIILNPKSGKTYLSQTSIVGKTSIMPNNSSSSPYRFDIYYDPNIPNYIQFEWSPVPSAFIYTALIRYYYTENNISKSADEILVPNDEEVKTSPDTYFLNFQSFKMNQFLIDYFGRRDTADHSVFRKITEIDYVVLSGSKDLLNAVDLSKPNTSLLQVKPDFSNIQNGLGLFTSRSTTTLKVPFDLLTPYSSEKNLTLNVRGFAQP